MQPVDIIERVEPTQSESLVAGREVVVETVFGTYRGVLLERHVNGTHLRLRAMGHNLWFDCRSIILVRAVGISS